MRLVKTASTALVLIGLVVVFGAVGAEDMLTDMGQAGCYGELIWKSLTGIVLMAVGVFGWNKIGA